MTILTQEEVRQALRDAGMSKKNAKIGSAIAMVEAPARGAPTPSADFSKIGDLALADEIWGYSYGGFQIRSLRADTGTGSFRDADELRRWRFNILAAKHFHDTVGWRAWSTFTSGQYKAYLQDMFPPPPNTYVVLAGDTLTTIADDISTGWTWEELAQAQNPPIEKPWTIYIGQWLKLPV